MVGADFILATTFPLPLFVSYPGRYQEAVGQALQALGPILDRCVRTPDILFDILDRDSLLRAPSWNRLIVGDLHILMRRPIINNKSTHRTHGG